MLQHEYYCCGAKRCCLPRSWAIEFRPADHPLISQQMFASQLPTMVGETNVDDAILLEPQISTRQSVGRSAPAQTLADQAYVLIEEMIVDSTLAPGQMISEGDLSRELNLGRTPVREAIARLKYIGFVEVHQRRGVLVSNLDPIKHLELLEVRLPLEKDIARLIIDRGSEDELDAIDGARRSLVDAAVGRDRASYFRAKKDLHGIEVRAARNSVLSATMSLLHAQSRRFWQTFEPTSSFAKGAAHHSKVVDAIHARDHGAVDTAVDGLFTFLQHLTVEVVRRVRFD